MQQFWNTNSTFVKPLRHFLLTVLQFIIIISQAVICDRVILEYAVLEVF